MTEQERTEKKILKVEESAEKIMNEEQINLFFEYGYLLEKRAILREVKDETK